jgi:two-component system chemotaxis response regulator CheB
MNLPSDMPPDFYRVVVVDDSAVIRGLVTRYLESQPGIKVINSYANGRDAVNSMSRHIVDVMILDIEMPIMDGLAALPLILEAQPLTKILISSSLTSRNADVSLQCLQKGASDYIPKPEGSPGTTDKDAFFREMHRKILALGEVARHARGLPPLNLPPIVDVIVPAAIEPDPETMPQKKTSLAVGAKIFNPALAATSDIKLRPWPTNFRIDAVAIGSSTGGPQALFNVLKHLKDIRKPVFLTQHMPPTFTTILAEHITKQTGLNAIEAKGGELAKPGNLYVAPGDYHMLFDRKGADVVLRLDQSPPENFCRPAVDPMLRSLADIYGARILVVILTGMGQDGLRGAQQVVASHGAVMAQDAATSVVWGMPGAVATAGVCSAVLPLDEIGPEIMRIATR